MFWISDYYKRLQSWSDFRNCLETSEEPFNDLLKFYSQAPLVSISVDPYDSSTWPDPWELIYENTYCLFSILLGMCYTLQLTERFSQSHFEIHIGVNKKKSRIVYRLHVDDSILCLDDTGDIGDYNDQDIQPYEVYPMSVPL